MRNLTSIELQDVYGGCGGGKKSGSKHKKSGSKHKKSGSGSSGGCGCNK